MSRLLRKYILLKRKRIIRIKPSIEDDNDNNNDEPITLVVDA